MSVALVTTADIEDLLGRQSEWAGHPVEPPNRLAVDKAKDILIDLRELAFEPSCVMQSGDGGVAFIFNMDGRYADIEVFNDGTVLAAVQLAGMKQSNIIAMNDKGISDLVGRMRNS